jgi:hypothetical protein
VSIDWTFRGADIAIVIATIAGPVLAVQAQKWLERGRSIDERRLAIFRTLMATRATRLSAAHVEALNAVPVEFYGRKKGLKGITDDWHEYLRILSDTSMTPEIALGRRQELFLNMLHKMASYLNYTFSRSELEKDIYYPTGHANIDIEQEIIRKGFVQLFKGETALPMSVTAFPGDDAAAESQDALRKLLTEWLEGQRVVKINQTK